MLLYFRLSRNPEKAFLQETHENIQKRAKIPTCEKKIRNNPLQSNKIFSLKVSSFSENM